MKRKSIIIIIIAIIVVAGIGYYVYKRKKKRERLNNFKPKPGEEKKTLDLTPELYEELIKERPKAVAKYLSQLYKHMYTHTHLFDNETQRKIYRNWLMKQRESSLKQKNYRKNLEYWLNGIVDNPEASIVKSFRKYVVSNEEINKLFTREALLRASRTFKDNDAKDDIELEKIPSILERETTSENRSENEYFSEFIL